MAEPAAVDLVDLLVALAGEVAPEIMEVGRLDLAGEGGAIPGEREIAALLSGVMEAEGGPTISVLAK